MSNKNYYDEKMKEIETLISENKFAKASEMVSEELRMPYIPKDYEPKFLELNQQLMTKLIDNSQSKSLTINEILDMLESKELETRLIGAEMLRTHNIRTSIKEIKQVLQKSKDTFFNAILFELMAEQEIDIDIKFGNKTLNPTKDSMFDDEEVIKAFNSVETLVEKQPQLEIPVVEEIKRYLLMTFPKTPKNGQMLAINIFNIVNSLMNPDFELSNEETNIKDILYN